MSDEQAELGIDLMFKWYGRKLNAYSRNGILLASISSKDFVMHQVQELQLCDLRAILKKFDDDVEVHSRSIFERKMVEVSNALSMPKPHLTRDEAIVGIDLEWCAVSISRHGVEYRANDKLKYPSISIAEAKFVAIVVDLFMEMIA